MRLVVGLGNIGSRYAANRHNVGFMVVDRLAEQLETSWKDEPKLKALVAKTSEVILAKPTTMMNGSGEAVQRLMQWYKIAPEDVWIVFDDLDIEFGQLRLREAGSSAGHNGAQSVIDHIGADFKRLRVGISMNDRAVEPSEVYVLRNFNADEDKRLPALIDEATKLLRSPDYP
jgi:PTH1 family peptidyl-tRNA hydrolase